MEEYKIDLDHSRLLLPVVSPIGIEVGPDLIPYIEGKENSSLPPKVKQICDDVRKDILARFGVKIPGFRFRLNELDLQGASYIFLINEIPVARGELSLTKKLFIGGLETLDSLGITGEEYKHPITGNKIWMLEQGDWETLEKEGYELWDPIEYLLRQLQAVLESHLSEFIGHQQLADLLSSMVEKQGTGSELTPLCQKILDDPLELSVLTFVLKNLVRERVPITAFEEIVIEYDNCRQEKKSPFLIVEAIRSITEIRPYLPGNNDQYSFYQIGPSLEDKINHSIDRSPPQPTLIMEPQTTSDVLGAVRKNVPSQQRVALLVENSQIRPFFKRLIEIEFPAIPVLSRDELLPSYESRIVKKIDL